MSFVFDASTGRYRDTATGRLVSEAKVRLGVDAVADAASERLATLSERMLRGELRLSEWQLEAMRTIKTAHVATAVVAHGGRAQMRPSDWGYAGSRIRSEYAYLREFANGIGDGSIPLDGQITARARMYGQGTRVTFEAVRARDDAARGFEEEKSVLHPSDHCAGCVSQAARGWVPLGTLLPIGSRDCLSHCRCTITRRKAPRQQEQRRLVAV